MRARVCYLQPKFFRRKLALRLESEHMGVLLVLPEGYLQPVLANLYITYTDS